MDAQVRTSPSQLSALFLALFCVLASCARRQSGMTERVRSIHFQDNGSIMQGTGDFHLRQAMQQEPGRWSTFLFPQLAVPLDRRTLTTDAWRIELWYAHHGYFDARFLGWDIRMRRPMTARRPAVVDIRGHVKEGKPTLVGEVVFEGLGQGGVHKVLLGYIKRNAAIQEGERFSLEAVQDTEALIRAKLRELGRAWAQVSSQVEVEADQHSARVSFTAEPGPNCKFGEVTLRGHQAVPENVIRDNVLVRTGRPFKASTLAATRRQLFALGTFSAVNIRPLRMDTPACRAPVEGEHCEVPVEVVITESKFRRLRAGVGVGVEAGEQDAHVSLGFRHNNLAQRLLQLDTEAELGVATRATYAELAAGEGFSDVAPAMDLSASLTVPRLFGRKRWSMVQNLAFEMGLESVYRFASPSWQPSLSYSFEPETRKLDLGRFTFTTGYKLTYFDYLDLEVDLSSVQESRLGLDLTDPFTLSFLEEKLIWDARDDPLTTRRGLYLAQAVGMAGGPFCSSGAPLFGQFNFFKGYTDLRAYHSIARFGRRGLVVAWRLGGGLAEPFGDEERASVPYAERFMLGGSNTVRGWVTDHLGTNLCQVKDEDNQDRTIYKAIGDGVECTSEELIPIGGKLYGLASLELRKPLPWDLGLVLFLDAGRAWEEPQDIVEQWILPAAGAGLRYHSPIGPVRLDFGFRLDHDELFEQEPRWNMHFSLSEAF